MASRVPLVFAGADYWDRTLPLMDGRVQPEGIELHWAVHYPGPLFGRMIRGEFEAGDPSYAVWTGCFWADGELPDPAGPDVKIWKTDSLTVQLDDSSGELLIQNSKNSKTTYSDDVKTESGGATHSVGSDGVVSEIGAGKVEVTQASVSVNNGAMQVV